ncbi:MAG: hypothetical protein V5783_04950 [Pontiella sp.]
MRSKKKMKVNVFVVGLLCLSTLPSMVLAADELELVPSIWGAWMRGSVNVDGQMAKVRRASDEYFSDLDYGYSLELVLRNNQMVLLGFVDYFDPLTAKVTVGDKMGTLDSSEIVGCIAVGYPLAAGNSTVDFLVGFQMLSMDHELELEGKSYSESIDVYDAVLMLRIKQELFSNCYINIPLSIGGTYLSDSQFVYDAGVQLLYQFGETFDVRAGYRISGYDLGEDDDSTDFYQQGYMLSLGLVF